MFDSTTKLSNSSGDFSDRVAIRPIRARALYRAIVKRGLDILFVLLIAPLVLPLTGLLALIVRRDGGRAFYTHERIGLDGRPFRCLKIRSMVPDADQRLASYLAENPEQARAWEVNQKLEQDPRITPFGDFLRKTSLDELPQFLNVLMGDMSVVGPRPFLPEQEDMYREAGGRAYFRLRPGVTGLWQVASRNRSAFIDRVKFDEAYWHHLGFVEDTRIILATIRVVLSRTGL